MLGPSSHLMMMTMMMMMAFTPVAMTMENSLLSVSLPIKKVLISTVTTTMITAEHQKGDKIYGDAQR